ncbi:GNAT family N-acetyltransferase [Paracoccus stylophorae]|uniref:GNAT family N-acetyltransferase n=1 Tax=Paracoccus stylophorae TaxID=659350 RepID=A0ABY7SVH2_9RHOB|nr:GNAT family N-acetyltransferase [Paracoccus stylophorae]WCR11027.1 GNAT family N-acetyltransferase [Paracoccus stylophorae]
MTQQPTSSNRALDDRPVAIRALTSDELSAATALLTRGMLSNPLHLKVFGVDPVHLKRRLSRFLGPLMTYVHSNGVVIGAFVQGQMIGVLGMIKPGYCRPRLGDRLSIAGSILTSAPPTVLLRIYIWLAIWARNDPDEPHWHIGPLAVLPENRQSGVGRHLMQFCCQKLDSLEATAWLETDLAINAEFYRSLGFVMVRKEPVLGVPIWFMSRSPEWAQG